MAWLAIATPVYAFGLSPATLYADNLVPGSHFEQEVVIVGTGDSANLIVKVKFNVPGANDWIEIDRGNEFKFSANNKKEKMLISVDVPQGTPVGKYKGSLNLEVIPEAADNNDGQVSINYGGQIDVVLNVGSKAISSFNVKEVKVFDLEAGGHFWFIKFPGIIKAILQIENTGNVAVAPDKIVLKIFDASQKQLLEAVSTDRIASVKPLTTGWTNARIKTNLPAGSYWATYEIYQGDKIIQTDKIHLSIMAPGTITDYSGANLWDLGEVNLSILAGVIVIILAGLIWGIIALARARY